MPKKSVRRSISMTPDMRDKLTQLVSKHPRTVTEADLIREAIRRYLDEQEDLIGSRRNFQRSFRNRIDDLDTSLTFQLTVLMFLIAPDEEALQEAIIRARTHGETLSQQIKAVRELTESDD
jgi:predicted DNA-binding protein